MGDIGSFSDRVNRITSGFRGKWKVNEPMSLHTTWRIGGPADLFTVPADEEDAALLIGNCNQNHVPWTVVGLGSNLLVADKGIRGVVIHLGKEFSQRTQEGNQVIVGAGCSLPGLARFAARQGLQGLAFAVGIPASVGGAVIMNAGAHGGSISDVLRWVDILDAQGCKRRLTREEMNFSYRHSRLQQEKALVLRACMDLHPGTTGEMEAFMDTILAKRKATQPLEWPNAGSVFLNPPADSAGRLIEKAGMKGFAIGGAQVSPKHANFIINTGEATAKDVLALIEAVKEKVRVTCGIELNSEVRVIGESGGQVDDRGTKDSH
ncbi:UDP-N-acetylmuramate dehydrogenase [Heliobacillus mobilis]|uniref:UDP-N-acetylenolpyruvoylglucosamine reductase n=1 Tax=Heliobacterium mobile TaxID=28064 RepID=A0A6I3SBB0_HELMO|nr:UDP-N-acetylmuramate dehydrogenase [Heliobacterium mobile]MTV47562.1 UDP-N-acetylmuramate dehydrogenase [Heliobacterium mobile]